MTSRILLLVLSLGAFFAPGMRAESVPPAPSPQVPAESFFYEAPSSYALSPTGRWLAFVLRSGGRTQLFTRDLISGHGFQLTGLDGDIDQLIWIDDARLALRT